MPKNKRWDFLAKVRKVVDGDTIDCFVDQGFCNYSLIRFRLKDIDAPETFGVKKNSPEYEAGMLSKDWLKMEIEGKTVMIVSKKTGKFGRWIATVWAKGAFDPKKSVNAKMVREGFAVFKKY